MRRKLQIERLEARELLAQNVLLVLTDDQRADTMHVMPKTTAILGTAYEQARVTTSLCCPSRASILTGQYASKHGVHSNAAPDGGFAQFNDSLTIATVLDDAGYNTGFVGKYLNGYKKVDPTYVPPGWDTWQAFEEAQGTQIYRMYNYWLANVIDGVVGPHEWHGKGNANYSTDVLSQKAVDFLMRTEANDAQPWFLVVAPTAGHEPYTPAPRHRYTPVTLPPESPAFNEADVSDKPGWVQAQPLLTSTEIATIRTQRTNELRMFLSVDDMVQRLYDTLVANGEWADTLVVYTSDHGIQRGEHRLKIKNVPYEESLRVPLLTNRPGNVSDLVLNIDLAPTFAAAAGVTMPTAHGEDILDGVTRTDFLVEGWSALAGIYVGLHTGDTVFIDYAQFGVEYYDLTIDPYQLDSDTTSVDVAAKRARILQIQSSL